MARFRSSIKLGFIRLLFVCRSPAWDGVLPAMAAVLMAFALPCFSAAGEGIFRQLTIEVSLGKAAGFLVAAAATATPEAPALASARDNPEADTASPPPPTITPTPPPQVGLRSVIGAAGSTRAGVASMGNRPERRASRADLPPSTTLRCCSKRRTTSTTAWSVDPFAAAAAEGSSRSEEAVVAAAGEAGDDDDDESPQRNGD